MPGVPKCLETKNPATWRGLIFFSNLILIIYNIFEVNSSIVQRLVQIE